MQLSLCRVPDSIDSFTSNMACDTHSHSDEKTPSPYHIIVLCLAEEDGVLGGGFHIKPMGFTGGVYGRSFDEFHADRYESLAAGVTDSDNVPFDTTNLRKSVVFDFVKCLNEDEYDSAEQMVWDGDTFQNIIEAVKQ